MSTSNLTVLYWFNTCYPFLFLKVKFWEKMFKLKKMAVLRSSPVGHVDSSLISTMSKNKPLFFVSLETALTIFQRNTTHNVDFFKTKLFMVNAFYYVKVRMKCVKNMDSK